MRAVRAAQGGTEQNDGGFEGIKLDLHSPGDAGAEDVMRELRRRMIEDMQLHGLAAKNQQCYVAAVKALAKS